MEAIPTIHIGKEIESRLNILNMSKSDFARLINTTRQNVNRILNRESLETSSLQKFSEVLGFNFFSLYCPSLTENYTIQGSNGIVAKNIQSIDNRHTQCKHTEENQVDVSQQSEISYEARFLIEKLTIENELLRQQLVDKERIISLYERGVVLPANHASDKINQTE